MDDIATLVARARKNATTLRSAADQSDARGDAFAEAVSDERIREIPLTADGARRLADLLDDLASCIK